PQIETYKIFDTTGKQILSGKYAGQHQSIDISRLLTGNYIIEITTKNGSRFSQKFIKK
ncbi:MAG TPA: T9SS C-terminal target domain-containing protein, partial [Chryseobacterium sp.]|nr:T9SS C-terminal target domain-containing protein [Chryseobacterium sp.]